MGTLGWIHHSRSAQQEANQVYSVISGFNLNLPDSFCLQSHDR
jgi:hypothetical protein